MMQRGQEHPVGALNQMIFGDQCTMDCWLAAGEYSKGLYSGTFCIAFRGRREGSFAASGARVKSATCVIDFL
eukprot:2684355-Pyramimonas_sp.AAC.1